MKTKSNNLNLIYLKILVCYIFVVALLLYARNIKYIKHQ